MDNTPLSEILAALSQMSAIEHTGLVLIAAAFVVTWAVIPVIGGFALVRSGDKAPISSLPVVAWVLVAGGGLLAPCGTNVIFGLAGIIMGAISLRSQPSARSKIFAAGAVVTGVVSLFTTVAAVSCFIAADFLIT
jgi:hypothetical protein